MFLTLLDQFNRQGRNTSPKPNAPTYAPTLFAKEKSARKHGIKKINFEEAMRSFFAADKIWLEPYGAPCRGSSAAGGEKMTCRTPCRTPCRTLSNPFEPLCVSLPLIPPVCDTQGVALLRGVRQVCRLGLWHGRFK